MLGVTDNMRATLLVWTVDPVSIKIEVSHVPHVTTKITHYVKIKKSNARVLSFI